MAKKSMSKMVGPWSFLIGVILAVILGFLGSASNLWLALLVIAGILVGLLNVTESESQKFLLAGLALVIVSAMGQNALGAFSSVAFVGSKLYGILNALLILFVPATIIVALKSVFELAKD